MLQISEGRRDSLKEDIKALQSSYAELNAVLWWSKAADAFSISASLNYDSLGFSFSLKVNSKITEKIYHS